MAGAKRYGKMVGYCAMRERSMALVDEGGDSLSALDIVSSMTPL